MIRVQPNEKPVAALAPAPQKAVAAVRPRVLVLVDETMVSRIRGGLNDWKVATFACGWNVTEVVAPRSEPGQPGYADALKRTRDLLKANPSDAVFFVGAVAKCYSGTSGLDGGHGDVRGAMLADVVIVNDLPTTDVAGVPRKASTTGLLGFERFGNEAGDGKRDLDFVQTKLIVRTFGRIDASRLYAFGVGADWTATASDVECSLVQGYLRKAAIYKLGWLDPIPLAIGYNGNLGFSEYSQAFTRDAGLQIPTTPLTDLHQVRRMFSIVAWGGGWSGSGPYLNCSLSWSGNRPTWDTRTIENLPSPIRSAFVFTYGSYGFDHDAVGSYQRAALLQPGSLAVGTYSIPNFAAAKFIKEGVTWGRACDVFQAHPTNNRSGDPTLLVVNPRRTVTDFNADGVTNFDDNMILSANYNKPGTVSTGDATGDGKVDFDDLLRFASAYNT